MTGPERDPAIARFAIMNLARWASAAAVLFGMAMIGERIGPSPALGFILVPLGMVGFFFGPKLLARRWRSPRE